MINRMALAYCMDPRQHEALRITRPDVFEHLITNKDTDLSEYGHHVYSGFPHEIATLLEAVRQWRTRPVPEERLAEILGDTTK